MTPVINGRVVCPSLRSEGLSWAAITSRLYADHGIEISAVTAADWHDQLAEEKAA